MPRGVTWTDGLPLFWMMGTPRGRPPGSKRVATACDSDGVSPTPRVRRLCGFLVWVKGWGGGGMRLALGGPPHLVGIRR